MRAFVLAGVSALAFQQAPQSGNQPVAPPVPKRGRSE